MMDAGDSHPGAPRRCGAKDYFCTVELVLQLIGGKWKAVILWHLGTSGTLRFGQLRRCLPGATQKMLTQQLRELEADGLVRRTVYAEVPPRVDYRLTPEGQSLMPVLQSLCAWGREYEAAHGGGPVAEAETG